MPGKKVTLRRLNMFVVAVRMNVMRVKLRRRSASWLSAWMM